jgi:hypothetical protein
MQKRITKINEIKERIEHLVMDVKVGMSQKATTAMFTSGINADMGDNESLL